MAILGEPEKNPVSHPRHYTDREIKSDRVLGESNGESLSPNQSAIVFWENQMAKAFLRIKA
jgi:hypothetical protein